MPPAKTHSGVGEVGSVDAKNSTVTLALEPVPSFNWPDMVGTHAMCESMMSGLRKR